MKRLKKGDLIIFIITLFVSLISLLLFNINNDSNKQKKAIIKINNEIYKQINLSNNIEQTETININLGYIKLGYDKDGIYVMDVTCPDKICQSTGKIKNSIQSIVCLPNKVIVYIEERN